MDEFQKTAKGKRLTYQEYIDWVDQMVENKQTSGSNQSEVLVDFTALNQRRMKRLNKTLKINEELLKAIKTGPKQTWWVITEAWCGDSAQNLPVIGNIAQASAGTVELNIIIRDENPALMDQYLTNGGAAIPKLIAFDENGKELFTLGPRPKPAAQLAKEWKTNPNGRSHDDFERELHTWYAKDKSQTIQEELLQLLTLG